MRSETTELLSAPPTYLTSARRYAAKMDVVERAVAAALRLVARAEMADVFDSLTLESLRNEIAIDGRGPAPSSATITRSFSTPGAPRHFDRDLLARALLDHVMAEVIAVSRGNVEVYQLAADTMNRGGGPDAIVPAVQADLKDYLPDAQEIVARERTYLLCYALADDEPAIARKLRETFVEARSIYKPVYERFLALTRRELAQHVSYDQLYLSVSGYLEAVILYRRASISIDDEVVADTIQRHFWAHTVPSRGPAYHPATELWAGIEESQKEWRNRPSHRRRT